MQAQLIYVGIGVAGFNPDRIVGDLEGGWISHGLASIAANLGRPVDFVDMRQLAGFEQFSAELKYADVFCLSISAVDYIPALKTVVEIKKKFPSSKIIVGGIHPTIHPEKYNNQYIDTVIMGEGEITLPKLLESQTFPKIIQGEKANLDDLKFVNREMFNYRYELGCMFTLDQKLPSVTMLAGRGCAYHCTYCQPAENAVFGKPFRIRSPENIMEELYELRQYNYKNILFWDDTFTFNPNWVMNFCDLYDLDADIIANSRADIISRNEDMVKRLAEVGLKWFVIGFESGSQQVLDFIKKGTTIEDNYKAAEICRKYGIKIFATYMYGLPTETQEDSLATAQMIKKIDPEHKSPFIFIPIEGTEIYKYCSDNDLIYDEVKERTIERTGKYYKSLKNIDYNYIQKVMTWQQ